MHIPVRLMASCIDQCTHHCHVRPACSHHIPVDILKQHQRYKVLCAFLASSPDRDHMALLTPKLTGALKPGTAHRAARTLGRRQPGVSVSSKRAVAVRLARPTDGDVGGSSSTSRDSKAAAAKKLQASATKLNKDLSSSSSGGVNAGAAKNDEQLIIAVDQANAELEKQALVKELQDEARNLKRDVMGSTKEQTPATSSQQLRSAVSKATAQVGPPVPESKPSSSSSSSKQGDKCASSDSGSSSRASKGDDESTGQTERAGRAVDAAAERTARAADEVADSAGDAAEMVARQMNDAVKDASAMAADAAEEAVDQAEDTVTKMVDGVEKNLGQGIDGIAGLAQGIADVMDEAVAPALGGYANNTSSSGAQRYSWQQQPGAGGADSTVEVDEAEVERVKVALLGAVSSLDRGLAANVREARDVDKLARQLERLGGPVTLSWKATRSAPNTSTMDSLSGTWRLIYSSGFNGGSLGGRRPGPQVAFVPTVLGQIYQVIDERSARLDNVVELLLAAGLPRLPFMSQPQMESTPALRLTLRHDYEVTDANTVRIVYEDTSLRLLGPGPLLSLPVLQPPQLPDFLKLPRNVRSAVFGVTYLDDSMRVTRGDRGELRIYLRDEDLERRAPADYVD